MDKVQKYNSFKLQNARTCAAMEISECVHSTEKSYIKNF
jgi:hypothetical protein